MNKHLAWAIVALFASSLPNFERNADGDWRIEAQTQAEAACWPSCWARKAKEAAQGAARRLREAAEATARKARAAADAARRAAEESARRVRAAAEAARKVAEEGARRAREAAEQAKRIVEANARKVAEAAAQKLREAHEKALKLAEEGARKVREAAEKAATLAREAADKAAKAAVFIGQKVSTAVVAAAKTAGNAVLSAANTVASAAKSLANAAWDKLKSLGFSFDMIKQIFCDTIGKGVCVLIDVVKAAKTFVERCAQHGVKRALELTLEEMKDAITSKLDRMKAKAEALFANFRGVLLAKEFKLATIADFAKKNFLGLTSLAKELLGPLTPFPMDQITSAAIGAVGTAALTPALAGIAALHFGFKKLLSYLIPKLILGGGGAFNWLNDHLPPGFWAVADKLMSFASGPGGKGLLAGVFVFSSPESKEKLKRIAASLSSAAGAVNQGIDGVMKLARGDSFKDTEAALGAASRQDEASQAAKATAQGKGTKAKAQPKGQERPNTSLALSPDQLKKLIDALAELAQERLIAASNEPIRKLMGKALQMLNRLLDGPRNALVAAVGSIPLVGGVVGAAMNFGLGIIIDMVGEYLTDQVALLAKDVITDVVADVKTTLAKELLRTPGNVKNAQGMVSLVQAIGKVAGEVSKLAGAAAGGETGLLVSALVGAIHTHLLKGIGDPDIRNVVATGIDAVAAEVTKRGSIRGYGLGQAAADVLRAIAKPLGGLVSRSIAHPTLKKLAGSGVESVLVNLANKGVSAVMANPRGFLSGVALEVLKKLKPELVRLLTDGIPSEPLKRVVAAAVDDLEKTVTEQGFSALMPFTRLLDRVGTALLRGGYEEFLTLLGGNVTKAKALLAAVAQRITTFISEAKTVTQPVLASLDEGAGALVKEASLCKLKIEHFDAASLKGLFGCLKDALGSAGLAVVQSLYRKVESALLSNCKDALAKVRTIAGLLAKAHPKLKGLADRVTQKFAARCAGKR